MARGDQRSRILTFSRYILALASVVTFSTLIRWQVPKSWFPFDLFLIATVVVALRRRPMSAQFFGLAAGFCRDAFSGGLVGLHALSLTTIAFVTAGFKEAVVLNNLWQQGIMFALATVAQVGMLIVVNGIFSLPYTIDWNLLIAETIGNTIVGFLVIFYIRRRHQRMLTIKG